MNVKEEMILPSPEQIEREILPHKKDKKIYSFLKRGFDIVMSAFALAVCALPMLIVAIIVKCTSEGPVLFKQPRVGRNGEFFNCLKFRTMYTSAPSMVATGDLGKSESYITPAGKVLRKLSLDELPQFINILKGDMSFVGPRPLIGKENEIHSLRYLYGVYAIRPGITGWAQINGRDKVSPRDKAKLDKYYYDKRSVFFDLKIIFLTVPRVLFGVDVVDGKKGKSDKRSNL